MATTQNFLLETEKEFEKIFQFLKNDLMTLRTNRATIEMVSPILVDAYGIKTPLKQLAQISVEEGRTFVIEPWDKNVLKNIEESLARADLGATPLSKGGVIRLTLPSLSEERRKALLRLLREKLENSRQKARTVRDRIKEQIVASFKEKEINEDEKYRLIEELNKKISELNKKIELLGEEKEKEIMNI